MHKKTTPEKNFLFIPEGFILLGCEYFCMPGMRLYFESYQTRGI